MSKQFIPRDKPKSWVIFVCAGMIGLLLFGPMLFFGSVLGVQPIRYLGMVGFVGCWIAMALSWIVFMLRMLTGKYRDLAERDWNEQVW